MSTEQSAFPLSWPLSRPRTPRHQIRPSAFGKHSLAAARDELLRELSRLGAARVVISTNIPLRKDGLPRADWRNPDDAGVAIYFRLRDRPTVFACDRWVKVEHNIWAIASTIAAQRGVTRWGSVEMEQAFSSYAALPPPTTEANNCWTVLELPFGSSVDLINERYRLLSQVRHPDRGGTQEAMAALNKARAEALAVVKGQP